MVDGDGFVELPVCGQRLGIALEALHAGAHLGHVCGDGEKVLIAGIDQSLRRVVHAVVQVGFNPARAWAVDGSIEENNRLAGAPDAVVNGLKVGCGLDNKTVDAQREHLVDIHELGLGIEVARADDRLIAGCQHDLLHAIEDEACPFVGVVQNNDGDDMGLLAGERLRLRVGNVSELLDDTGDFCLCLFAQLVALVVEVIRDASR